MGEIGRVRSDGEIGRVNPGSDYVESVLAAVESIPPGRVLSYGDVAELVGRGGPRQVGLVLSRYGSAVPWWRVVRADGRPVAGLAAEATGRLRTEGAPVRGGRVVMTQARWGPRTVPETGG